MSVQEHLRVTWTTPTGYPTEHTWVRTGEDVNHHGDVVGFINDHNGIPSAIVLEGKELVVVVLEDLKVYSIGEIVLTE